MKFAKIILIIFAILLVIFVVKKNQAGLRIQTVQTAKPAFNATNQIFRRINPFRYDKNKVSLAEGLKTKIKILEARLAGMKEISSENERLRGLLDFRKKITYETLPAQVIGRDPSNWTNIVYIDRGTAQDIKPDTGVVTDKGVVGKIVEAGDEVSKVMLINDPDSRIAAVVQRSREGGVLCGTLSRRCRMIYISVDSDVKIGDEVVTADSGMTFSKGFLIGKIVDLYEDKGGLYRSAEVMPAADLQRLEEVLCIK